MECDDYRVGYAKQGEMESARTLFDEVTKGDVVTWNATIAVYVLCGSNEQAFQMFKEMGLGEKPDVESLVCLHRYGRFRYFTTLQAMFGILIFSSYIYEH
ncbi:hypothetical protein GBA52_025405 [Prunus armeniaca]|nr:hypothetical protein GBA52_025405 [Prunus armeniaca]